MPLIKSGSKKAIGENIRREKDAHPDMPIKQAAAIAYSTARSAGAKIPKKGKSSMHKKTMKDKK